MDEPQIISMPDGIAETSLKLDTPIYRIIHFFELYDLLNKQHLRISKASRFDDENEAIDEILRTLQVVAGPCRGGIGQNWEGKYHDAIRAHNETKNSAFVSSWSKKSDSVAMWSLYSKDLLGVRIKTTVGKLLKAVSLYQAENSPMALCKIGKNFTCATGQCFIEPVSYVNVEKMLRRVVRRKKAYDKLELTFASRGIQPYDPNGNSLRYTNFLNLPEQHYLIKDDTFSYEEEIRAVIRVGRLNHGIDDELTPEEIIHAKSDIARFQHTLLGKASPEDFEDNIFLKIDSDFIEDVCFDPRGPGFKNNQMLLIIEKFGVSITESRAFGYLPGPYHFSKQYLGKY